jgi:hypothetical protein
MDTEKIIGNLQNCNDIEELHKINSYCYKKIGILIQMKALSFSIGDRVCWESKGDLIRHGIISKILSKKAEVRIKSGEIWTVGITFLKLDSRN